MIEIIPSLPAGTYAELTSKIEKVRGLVNTFQIDVCDGLFVPSISWPMHDEDKEQFKRLVVGQEFLPYRDVLHYEVHFMTHHPENLIDNWIAIGVTRALFHVESDHDFGVLVEKASGKIELGISVNIGTPLSLVESYIRNVSVVQLMGIATIGIQGQPFDGRVIDSIKELKKQYPTMPIEIDGAVNADTAPQLIKAGATRLAPGSFVLNSENPSNAIHTLISAVGV